MPDLPHGTVTFLFSDVEGSTQLLRALGRDRYASALDEHRRLVGDAVSAHNGLIVDSQGDAFFVVFRLASDAVAAGIAAQRELAQHGWPEGAELRVRIGIHTGEAQLESERYLGLAVHRAARICAAAHGGQIVLSQATEAVLADEEGSLADIRLRDLGTHVLKDFERAVRLYDVVGTGLRSAFPPPRTVAQTGDAPFAGREVELGVDAARRLTRVRSRWIAGVVAAAIAGAGALGIVLATRGSSRPPQPRLNTVVSVDERMNRIVDVYPSGRGPGAVAVLGHVLWVTNTEDLTVRRIDLDDGSFSTLTGLPDVGPVVSDPSGRGVWMSTFDRPTVVLLARDAARVIKAIATPPHPAAVTLGGGFLWVVNFANKLDNRAATITAIDPATARRVTTLGIGRGPRAVAYGFGAVWTANVDDQSVSVVRVGLSKAQTLPFPSGPFAIATGNGSVWIGFPDLGAVWRLDPVTRRVKAKIDVGNSQISSIAVDRNAVWVANGQELDRIDPHTNEVVKRIEFPLTFVLRSVTVGRGRAWVSVASEPL